MPPQQQNQYDFILNGSPKAPRRPLFGNSLGARIAVIAVLVILVIIAGAVINSFLGKDKAAQTQRLVEISQAQTEIVRVSALANEKAKDGNTRNYALTTQLSVQSSQQQIMKTLAARGVSEKSVSKKLAASKNPKTDAALDEAVKNSRFDETFTTILDKQIADYQLLLQTAYEGSSVSERTALTACFENAKRLAAMAGTEATQ